MGARADEGCTWQTTRGRRCKGVPQTKTTPRVARFGPFKTKGGHLGTRPEYGPRGLATPGRAGACGRPPTIRSAAGGPGGRWGSVVLGWRALRPPRVVFVIGVASLINSLTSGKDTLAVNSCFINTITKHESQYKCLCRLPLPSACLDRLMAALNFLSPL